MFVLVFAVMTTSFSTLLNDLIRSFGGTKQEFASAAKITASTLSHLLAAHGGHPPGTEVCLRIAKAGCVSASLVLRAAGKGDVADLIEELYGAPAFHRERFAAPRLTPREKAHLDGWRSLDPRTQRALTLILERATAATRPTLFASRRRRQS
jgi:hypothetical protein